MCFTLVTRLGTQGTLPSENYDPDMTENYDPDYAHRNSNSLLVHL